MQTHELWRRSVDDGRLARHRRRLVRWCLIPIATLVVLEAIVSGPWEALGVLILVGSIGGLVAAGLLLTGRNVRVHPVVTIEGRDLCWSKHRVPIDQVVTYRTGRASSPVTVGDVTSYHEYGYCRFALVDRSEVTFRWTDLPDAELDGLSRAMAQMLPGREDASA